MMLFIGNLPRQAKESDLIALLGLSDFERQRVRIVKKLTRSGEMTRFGLFQAKDDAQARKTLLRNGKLRLNGRSLTSREFVKRVAGNDRRRPDWRMVPWGNFERRIAERRTVERAAA
jgi:hypothetical protein